MRRARRCATRSTRRGSRSPPPARTRRDLDAELLLAHALGVDRAALVMDPDRARRGRRRSATFQDLVRRRSVGREPVAYLLGTQGLPPHRPAGRPRACSSRGPRPSCSSRSASTLAAGRARRTTSCTGSGAVALALKHERPDLRRHRQRRRAPARSTVARANAQRLGLDVDVRRRPTCSPRAGDADAVLANPPYVEDGARAAARAAPTSRRRRCSPAPTASTSSGAWSPRCAGAAAGARGRRGPGAPTVAELHGRRRRGRSRDLAGIERVVVSRR